MANSTGRARVAKGGRIGERWATSTAGARGVSCTREIVEQDIGAAQNKARLTDRITGKLRQLFPEGTPVILREESKTGRGVFVTLEIVGTVVGCSHEPTGAWYAENGDPNIPNAGGKLQLRRLRLRMVDGEITDTIVDDLTSIAKLEAE